METRKKIKYSSMLAFIFMKKIHPKRYFPSAGHSSKYRGLVASKGLPSPCMYLLQVDPTHGPCLESYRRNGLGLGLGQGLGQGLRQEWEEARSFTVCVFFPSDVDSLFTKRHKRGKLCLKKKDKVAVRCDNGVTIVGEMSLFCSRSAPGRLEA